MTNNLTPAETYRQNHVIKDSSELRQGDIVLSDGMVLLIDREIMSYDPNGPNGPGYNTRAQVLNLAEIEANDPWLAGFILSDHRYADTDVEVRWTIQGNRLATWCVRKAAATFAKDAWHGKPSPAQLDAETLAAASLSLDNDIATCGACGEVEHTPEQLADCIDSALGPRRDPEA